MKLHINCDPPERLRTGDGIPLYYIPDVSSFAKPELRTSSYVDIMYQELAKEGYTLRSYFFHVHKPVNLIATIGSPKVCLTAMFSGEAHFEPDEQSRLSIQQGEYAVLYLNANPHFISFQPGKHAMVRFDYSVSKLERYGMPYRLGEAWLQKIAAASPAVLDKGTIDDTFTGMVDDIKRLPPGADEDEYLFYEKCRNMLRLVLGEKNLSQAPLR